MQRKLILSLTLAITLSTVIVSTGLAVDVNWGADGGGGSFCTNPIYDASGSTPLSNGDLVHLIHDSAGDGIDPPDVNGNPTDDDVLLATSTIDTGTFGSNSGCFSVTGTPLPTIVNGDDIYVRAFDDSTIMATTAYGNSPIFTVSGEGISFTLDATASGSFSAGAPLAATLATFSATSQPDHVLVDWATVFEQDHLGFNVLRSTSPDGAQTTLNADLIPSQAPGSGQGASYVFEDYDVEDGTTYFYWLEDVDTSGTTGLHGPVSVTYESNATAVEMASLSTAASSWQGGLLGSVLLLAAAGYLWYWRRRGDA